MRPATAVLSGWVSQGPQVAAFERDFAALVGARSEIAPRRLPPRTLQHPARQHGRIHKQRPRDRYH